MSFLLVLGGDYRGPGAGWKGARYAAAMNRGVYLAIFHLSRPQRITVGSLGKFRFSRGYYLYVGSAQKNLGARLARHGRRKKRLRWHIDYLSVRAPLVGALMIEGPKSMECALAALLAQGHRRPIKGFGASDCRCDGHLFYERGLARERSEGEGRYRGRRFS